MHAVNVSDPRPSVIAKAGASVQRNFAGVLSHALFLGGLGLVVYGAGLMWAPLRFVVGGAVLFWIGVLIEKDRSGEPG